MMTNKVSALFQGLLKVHESAKHNLVRCDEQHTANLTRSISLAVLGSGDGHEGQITNNTKHCSCASMFSLECVGLTNKRHVGESDITITKMVCLPYR